MDSAVREKDLLFGLMAVHSGLVDPPSLVAAFTTWKSGQAGGLAEVLVQQGALRPDERTLVESLVRVQSARQSRDAGSDSAALSLAPSIHDELFRLADGDLRAALAKLAPPLEAATAPGAAPSPALDETLPEPGGKPGQGGAAGGEAATRFRVLRPHARGGLGEVYVAMDRELNREVALKEIQSRHAAAADTRLRFIVEAEITGGLEHPGIVPVYGLGTYPDGRPFYAMRLIRGESLKQALDAFYKTAPQLAPEQRRFELRQLIGRLISVCEAIEYAHSRGILHRDIKPGNIMLGKYGETLVVDWGLAKSIDGPDTPNAAGERQLVPLSASGTEGTQMGAAVGTPQFMSPEQARGEIATLGPETDVYSLGATLYSLVVGRPAYVDPNVPHLVERVKRGDFPPPRSISAEVPRPLEAICLKAMALAPANRYPSAKSLANDLERYLADEPVWAYREPWPERLLRWLRRHRTWALAIGASLVLVSVAAVTAGWMIDRARRAESAARRDAEESLALARRTVDDFFTQVSESQLLNVPGLQPLRKELLEKARDYYQQFIDRHAGEPALAADLAQSHYRLAQVQQQVGAKRESLASLRTALDIQKGLTQQNPLDAALSLAMSDTLNQIGNVQLDLGQPEESLVAFRRALAERSNLVAAAPNEKALRRKLANAHANVSAALARLNQFDDACDEAIRANLAREGLISAEPANPQLLRDLAQGQYNLALLKQQAGDLPAALAIAETAVATYDRLIEIDRKPIDFRREAAVAQRLSGELAAEIHPAEDALARLQAARETAEALARENPFLLELRADVAAIYTSLGRTESRVNGSAAAAAWYSQALAVRRRLVAEDPASARFRQDLAGNWLQLGTTQLAADQFDAAGESFQAGLALLDQLAAEQPDDVKIQDDIGQGYTDMGLVYRLPGDSETATQWFDKALATYEKLARLHPDRVEGELGRADSLLNLAVEARTQGRPDEAASRLAEAIGVQRRLCDQFPRMVKYREVLGEMLYLDAVLAAGSGSLEAAAKKYNEVRILRQQLVEDFPDNLGNRSSLGVVLDEAAIVQWKLANREQAQALALAAAEHLSAVFAAAPEVVQYRRNLSNHYTNAAVVARQSGRLDDAADFTAKRAALWPADAAEQYKAAVSYTLIANALDRADPPPVQSTLAREELLNRAAAALEAAVLSGWTAWPDFENDPRLESLRGLPRVRKLAEEHESL